MSRSSRVVTWQRTAAVELVDGDTRVVVVPELGMLVAAFVVDGFDHVARPGGTAAVCAGHTTGVPLLHPWANRLAKRSYRVAGTDVSLRGLALHTDGNGRPIHGTMLGRPGWEVGALGRGRLQGRFDFAAHPELLRSFPFPHEVRVSVSVGRRRLRIVTEIHAGRSAAVPVAFGWHPYWRVPGPRDRWALSVPEVARRVSRPARDPHRSGARGEGRRRVAGGTGPRRPLRVHDDPHGHPRRRRPRARGRARRRLPVVPGLRAGREALLRDRADDRADQRARERGPPDARSRCACSPRVSPRPCAGSTPSGRAE